MTDDEALAVIRAASMADGECLHCGAQVITELIATLPDIPWTGLTARILPDLADHL